MNTIQKMWNGTVAAVKAFTMTFQTQARSWYYGGTSGSGRSTRNYVSAVGDGTSNAIVVACVDWLARTFQEAPLRVRRYTTGDDGDQELEDEPRHPLLKLMRRPNPYYSGRVMMQAFLADRVLTGNAYLVKVRSAAGIPVQLWWVPSWMMEPRWPEDGKDFLSHYDYTVNSTVYRLEPGEVVHSRHGLDPANPRKGRSRLGALLRDIFTDDEAATFSAAVLANMGVMGVIISPADNDTVIESEQAQQMKSEFEQKTTGDNRGRTLVLSANVKVDQPTISPESMNLRDMRQVPEERISAVLGTPAVLVGLGAGLEHCLPADARVWTPTGPARMGDISPGRIVWSLVNGRLEPRRVTAQWRTGHKALYEIRTKNRTLRATDNHPVLVRVPGSMGGGDNASRRPSLAWKRVDELQVGDRVVQAKALPDQGETRLPDGRLATTEALQFFGAIIGDGTVSPGVGVRMAMPPGDRCVTHYRTLASALFTKHGGAPIMLQERVADFGFGSVAASLQLAEFGLAGRARTKRVPSWVWPLTRELRLAFLAGIVDTDGYIDPRGALQVTFCNRDLAHDVRDLLVSVGIQCCNVRHSLMSAAGLPNPGLQEEYDSYAFTASSAAQVAAIPFVDPLYRQRVEANASRLKPDGFDAHKAGLSDDLGFYSVTSIRELPAEDVYDIEVEGGHSFLCDGLLVHNSIYNNYSEAREAAFEEHIIPLGKDLAEEFMIQLMPDFDDPDDVELDYDLREVRMLQEDTNAKYERMVKAAGGPIMDVSEARQQLGLDALPTPFWWQPTMVSPTPVEELMGTAEAEPAEEPAVALAGRIVANGHSREKVTV